MTKTPPQRPLTAALAALLLLTLALVAGFNRLVDPYGFYGAPVIDGFNALKFRFTGLEPETKLRAFTRQQPASIILGTSRAALGISAQSPHWVHTPVYNLAWAGAGTRPLALVSDYAFSQPNTQTAVLMLDFFSFNAFLDANNFQDTRYKSLLTMLPAAGNRLHSSHLLLPTLLSMQALRDSVFTVQRQSMNRRHLDTGGNWVGPGIGHFKPQRTLFDEIEAESLDLQYFPLPARRFALQHNGYSTLDDFRSILASAHRHGIDLRIGISPRHVRLQALLQASGMAPVHSQWKQALVTINHEEATRAGKLPFILIDFSGISDYTTEALAPAGDKDSKLRWFIDPGHYTPELGDILLQQLLGNTGYSALGHPLDPHNVTRWDRYDNDRLAAWLAHHPEVADTANTQWQTFLRKAPTASVESPGL